MYVPAKIHRDVKIISVYSLGVIAPTLLPLMLESKKGVTFCNPQPVMRHFDYDQDAIILIGELSASSFYRGGKVRGHGVSQIIASKERFF